jgi:hypothetical protein
MMAAFLPIGGGETFQSVKGLTRFPCNKPLLAFIQNVFMRKYDALTSPSPQQRSFSNQKR